MKACARYAPMLGARAGELSDEETRGLADHLATCEACQARLADEEATSGLLSSALMDEANRRDFSTFSDEVLARIPEYGTQKAPVHPERSAEGAKSRGLLTTLADWARHHRAAAAISALAPTLAAAALLMYFASGSPPAETAAVEVHAEGRTATVLETSDGPMVLFGDGEPEGS
jgi:anti-sigma factor RsiW